MESPWTALFLLLCISVCNGEETSLHHNVQSTDSTHCPMCPRTTRTTTHHTTKHTTTQHITTHPTTAHTNHTTTLPTTAHTNHTTHPTTAHTNHTTTLPTTAHTNHTTHPTTAHTNHTTTLPTTAHTNHTTHPTTAHTNHTTTHPTTAHTNHTTTLPTTAHTNHTTHPTTAHTNHTTTHPTTEHANHTTTHPTTAHTNHTTTHPTSMPPPVDFFINGSSGVCLRITASLEIMFNFTEKEEIHVPPPPVTKVSGNCSADRAEMILRFTGADLSLLFRKDAANNVFFLEQVNITVRGSGSVTTGSTTLKAMVTPLGRSFSCPHVTVDVIGSKLSLEATNLRAQAFELQDGNYGTAMDCANHTHSMTAPIVVGVVLVVLILVVVLAYIFGRRRTHGGYQPL